MLPMFLQNNTLSKFSSCASLDTVNNTRTEAELAVLLGPKRRIARCKTRAFNIVLLAKLLVKYAAVKYVTRKN